MAAETGSVIALPLVWLPVLALFLALSIGLSLHQISRLAAQPKTTSQRLPELGTTTPGTSWLHRWDPRCKLAGLLGFALLATALTSPPMVFTALLLAAASVVMARLPWQRSLRRLQAINGFLILLLIVLPLSAANRPEDTLVIFGSLQSLTFNLRGLLLALTIAGKAWTVALLIEPMLATAPLSTTMAGLSQLGVPRKISELLLIAYRYLFVFRDEAARMRNGMLARGFQLRRSWAGLRDLGNFLGMLLVRSFERTEQVQQAMLARGYNGHLPHHQPMRAMPVDLLGTGLVIGLGIMLLLIDRLAAG